MIIRIEDVGLRTTGADEMCPILECLPYRDDADERNRLLRLTG